MKNYSFQGLRGLFAIGVLFSHCYFLGDYAQSSAAFEVFFRRTANVSFFFMISGYFLFNSVMKSSGFFEFIKKKLLRIYPLHIILVSLLVFNSILSKSFEYSTLNIVKAVSSALLIQTWIPSAEIATSYNTVSWFLSSLLFCYIAGYWIGRFVKSKGDTSWKYIYFLTAALYSFRIIIAVIYPTESIGYYFCYLCPISGLADLLMGAIVAHNIKDIKGAKPWIQVMALLIILATFLFKQFVPVNYSRAFLLVPGNVLLVCAFAKETNFSRKLLGNKLFTFLGDISFEVYLIHVTIIGKLSRISVFDRISSTVSPFLTLFILIILCVVCALIYKKTTDFILKQLCKKRED